MHRVLFAIFVVVLLLAAGLTPTSTTRSAQDPGTPAAATPAASPQPICSPAEIAKGDSAVYLPPGLSEGIVKRAAADAESLYLAVLTLPADSCIDFRQRIGPIIIFVQEGSIVYTSEVYQDPDVVIMMGDSDGNGLDNQQVAPGTSVTLHAGQWITQDRRVWFSFRNSGSDDAVIAAAGFAPRIWDDERCDGGCRGRP